MLPILDNAGMRECDRHTINDLGVPGIVLMENAATGVVDSLRDRFPSMTRVLILCGRGNNGGDGLAMARHLHISGYDVRVMVFADSTDLRGDAATNAALAANFGVPVIDKVDFDIFASHLEDDPPELIVDALLGTGLDRPLGGRLAQVVERLNAEAIPIIAVDVPTGLNGSTSTPPGLVLSADLTVTFAALKICHTLPPASEYCGEIAIVDIGIPPKVLRAAQRAQWVEDFDMSLMLPRRGNHSHKGTYGHLGIMAGARGRAGAVAMAANTAVVCGAGLVTMAVPEPLVPVVDGACLEAMTLALEANPEGEIASADGLAELFEKASAIAVGPGMGTGTGAKAALQALLDNFDGPTILDADAVNLLAGRAEALKDRAITPVLTPHPGELARLLECTTADIVDDRLAAAREAASRSGAVIVAKGFRSIIAAPDGEVWINPTGDAHLASGGAGDVLTGAIGALLAQGCDPERAALLGCWLHGRAGEIGGEVFPAAVPASRLPALIADAWLELEENLCD